MTLLDSVAAVLSGRGLASLHRAEQASLAVPEDCFMYIFEARTSTCLYGIIWSMRRSLDLDLPSDGVDILTLRLDADHCGAISVSGG